MEIHRGVAANQGKKVQRQINPDLKVDDVLLTLADMRTNLARAATDGLKQNDGRFIKVYRIVIPVSAKAAETSMAGKSGEKRIIFAGRI